MASRKGLLTIVAALLLSTASARALDLSISFIRHVHPRKTVVVPPRRGPHCPTVVVRPPWAKHSTWHHQRPHHWTPVVVHHHRPRRIILVAPPRLVVHRPVCTATLTIWITHSNGSKTPVTLIRKGTGYIGPRGEYYCVRPTQRQLRVVYGF